MATSVRVRFEKVGTGLAVLVAPPKVGVGAGVVTDPGAAVVVGARDVVAPAVVVGDAVDVVVGGDVVVGAAVVVGAGVGVGVANMTRLAVLKVLPAPPQ